MDDVIPLHQVSCIYALTLLQVPRNRYKYFDIAFRLNSHSYVKDPTNKGIPLLPLEQYNSCF
jgi:hypothetical protein